MPTNILMPALSPTMEKGNLARWLKKEGDKVVPGDVIAEIETDKATMEVEAIDEGVIARIMVPEGTEDVPVNDVIAVLAAEGEDLEGAAASGDAPKEGKKSAEKAATSAAQPAREDRTASKVSTPATASSKGDETAARSAEADGERKSGAGRDTEGRSPATNGHDGERVFSSPLARRLARDAGIEIASIEGSGPRGRVIARDVEQAKSGKGLKAPAASAKAQATTAGAAAPVAALSDDKVRALFADGSYEVVPHDAMRRVIAQRLTQSTQTVPHFYLTIDCTIDRLVTAREEINAAAPKDKDGKPAYKLSVNDFVIKALALALQRVPDANVSWTEAGMLKHKHSDVGVAVALPGGLITPIIRKAEQKSLSTIAGEMKDLATRARSKKLKPDEYQGGTTAVSNLGMYGIKDFTAVINPPHATILAVGTGEQRPVVREGRIEIATIMSVTLSCDHRAVDGALGAELITAFRALIENPVMMVV